MMHFWGQTVEGHDLVVVLLLVLLEGILSIDNALVLGLLAKRLPKHLQTRALTYGLVGAFVFRFIAVGTAAFLLRWTFVKFLGGAYLVYISVRHLWIDAGQEDESKAVLDPEGQPALVDAETGQPITKEQEEVEIQQRLPVDLEPVADRSTGKAGFWPTVVVIELTDIAFAVDSILAAMALVGNPPSGTPKDAVHPKLWVVIVGGLLGLILMRFAAAIFIRLLERFPRFEVSAYLLVLIIGLKLLADWGLNSDWSMRHPAWLASRLGSWKESFHRLEHARRDLAKSYERWLSEHWILTRQADPHIKPPDAGANGLPDNGSHAGVVHPVHVVNFHDLRRPECLLFWLLMVVCFLSGFHAPRVAETTSARGH